MEVASSSVNYIIDIADEDDDVAIIYATPKNKGKNTSEPISVEEYFGKKNTISSLYTKPSSSGTKKVMIDLSNEYQDDEIQILGTQKKGCSNFMTIDIIDDHEDIFTCDICVDEKSMTDMFKIMGCTHSYCKQCMAKYVASKIQENISQIPCPVPECNGLLEPYYCRSILPKEVFDRWGDVLCEKMIMGSERFYCPFKDCSALLIDGNLDIKESECPECRRLFCAKCKVPWHSGIVCEEFQKLHKDEREKEDIQLMQLAKNQEWKRCPRCRIFVARSQGCAQMQCRCGCGFCYRCGAQSTNHMCPKCGVLNGL